VFRLNETRTYERPSHMDWTERGDIEIHRPYKGYVGDMDGAQREPPNGSHLVSTLYACPVQALWR